MGGVIEVDLGDISPVNLSLCQSNLLKKSNLLEPIEPIILQSSLCVTKSEQEAATVFEIRQRKLNAFIQTLTIATHWLTLTPPPPRRP